MKVKRLQVKYCKLAEVIEILTKNHILYLTEFQKLILVEKKDVDLTKYRWHILYQSPIASWRELDK